MTAPVTASGMLGRVLVVMAGLPGSGRSAVAEDLAKALRCAVLPVDPVEAAMWRSGVSREQPTGIACAFPLTRRSARQWRGVAVDPGHVRVARARGPKLGQRS